MLQFQHVYTHMNMHVKMHMNMHMYKPVTHTDKHAISSAKPHGFIIIGWCGSGSHLDVDGASV